MKRIISFAAAILLIMAIAVSMAESADANEYYVYTENGKALNVYEEPGEKVVGSLEVGTKVQVVAKISDAWTLIMYTYDKDGSGKGEWPAYVNTRFIIGIAPEDLKAALEEETQALTGDPVTDINNEFLSAVNVQEYRIKTRPARVTSWVPMRWVPSETGIIIHQYKAGEELIVLKELNHYLQVKDPVTGDIGYVHKKFGIK